jgi:hypothetical protein
MLPDVRFERYADDVFVEEDGIAVADLTRIGGSLQMVAEAPHARARARQVVPISVSGAILD